jgi:hypothetical protein
MSPGVFVERLAEILGLPSKSVVVIDRALLEAGLRSRGGRGRSAARVTTVDAAALLLAVMATPVLVRADEVVATWRNVKSWRPPPSMPEPFGSAFSGTVSLPLQSLMERLIEAAPEDFGDTTFVLDVSVDQLIAMLHVHRPGKKDIKIGFLRYPEEDTNTPVSPPAHGDMTRYAKVTQVTFQELHRALYPSPHRAPGSEPARGRQA